MWFFEWHSRYRNRWIELWIKLHYHGLIYTNRKIRIRSVLLLQAFEFKYHKLLPFHERIFKFRLILLLSWLSAVPRAKAASSWIQSVDVDAADCQWRKWAVSSLHKIINKTRTIRYMRLEHFPFTNYDGNKV